MPVEEPLDGGFGRDRRALGLIVDDGHAASAQAGAGPFREVGGSEAAGVNEDCRFAVHTEIVAEEAAGQCASLSEGRRHGHRLGATCDAMLDDVKAARRH
jgi:hypothetical protein